MAENAKTSISTIEDETDLTITAGSTDMGNNANMGPEASNNHQLTAHEVRFC